MKNFPTLFKKTSSGAIQYWNISVEVSLDETTPIVRTRYGQHGGKEQTTGDVIVNGKNKGKKNETSALQQAEKEAEARWTKQLKKGYVDSIRNAEIGVLDEIIEGGIEPMLAHNFNKHGQKISFPAFGQMKLDGIRCIAIVEEGVCTLWSRTRKQITSMPHIVAELEACFHSMNITLDGELYNHKYKNNFEKIVSMVRQDSPDKDYEEVQYHVYDVIQNDPFEYRWGKLVELFEYFGDALTSIRLVKTLEVNEEHVTDFFLEARLDGYEGVMLRNKKGTYENKRSYNLQKVKEFDDAEFTIVGTEEGRGRLAGHVGAFRCQDSVGNEFMVKMSGDTKKLKEYFLRPSLWVGKRLTVQYQGLTVYGIPRFPVGIRIREDE